MIQLLLIAIASIALLGGLVRSAERRMAFFPARGQDATPADLGIAFEAVTLRTADGEQLQAWLLSPERPRAFVLYFHGNGGNLSVWLPILAGVVRHGYSVGAIDYRGYGNSTGMPSERGLYRDADAAVDWAAKVRPAGVPLVFWGRSLGTAVAAYAATKARPDRMILESGFADARSLFRGSKVMAVLSLLSSYRFNTAGYAAQAGCPVLVMHGDADEVIAISHGRALYEAIREPKRFEVLRGGTHNQPVPPDAERYWQAIDGFITGDAPDGV
jgi:fermentation-respiration switch protein FrsA (DUF1100 family)